MMDEQITFKTYDFYPQILEVMIRVRVRDLGFGLEMHWGN